MELPATLTDPGVRQAMKELQVLSEIEQERQRYEARLKAQKDAMWIQKQGDLLLQKGHNDGLQEGLRRGELVGVVHLCQRRLHRPVTPAADLLAVPLEELHQLAQELERAVFNPSAPPPTPSTDE